MKIQYRCSACNYYILSGEVACPNCGEDCFIAEDVPYDSFERKETKYFYEDAKETDRNVNGDSDEDDSFKIFSAIREYFIKDYISCCHARDDMFLDETAFDYFNDLERKAQKHSTQYYPLRDFLRFSLLLETLVLNNNVILPVFHEDSPYVRAISRFYNINNLIDNELICFAWSESEKLFHNTGLCNHIEKKFINIPYRSYLDDYLHEFVLDIGGYVNTLSTDPSKWFFYRTKFNSSYSAEIASDKKLYVKACNVLPSIQVDFEIS